MKKTLSITILLAMLCALLSGCGAQSEPEGEGISVVATVFAPYDFARQLVGERGEVTLLLPPGSEAHSYEPSPKDIIEIQNCDLFIYVGGVSDAWVSDVLESVGGEVRTVTLMDCVELLEEEHVEGMEVYEDEHEGEIEYDEHVWTSPRNAELICEKIAAARSWTSWTRPSRRSWKTACGTPSFSGTAFRFCTLPRPTGSITTRPGRDARTRPSLPRPRSPSL